MSRSLGKSWIESYLQYTRNTEPSESYRLWAALSAISSVVQRKVWIRMGSLVWYPNLYCLLVGPPAARKSTSIDPLYELLRDADLDLKFASNKGSTIDLVKDLQRSERSFYVEGKQFVQSPVVILSREFSVFIKKEPDGQIYDLLNEAFDCGPYFEYGTISRNKERADMPVFTLLGCITPEQLTTTFPEISIGGGFTSRFVMVYGRAVSRRSARKTSLIDSLHPKLVSDLRTIHDLTGPFEVSESYYEVYEPWYENTPNPKHLDNKLFSYYCERRATHLNKIAAIFSIAESDKLLLTSKHFRQALTVLQGAETHMPKIFQDFGANKDMKVYDDVKDYLELNKEVIFSRLLREFWKRLPDPAHDKLEKFLETGVQARWLQLTGKGPNMKIRYIKGSKEPKVNGISEELENGLFHEQD